MLAAVAALALAGLLAGSLLAPSLAAGSLASRVESARSKEAVAAAKARYDGQRIARLNAPIADFQAREDALQSSLDVQQGILDRLQRRLRTDRARLVGLRMSLKRDNAVLAAQLRASYETPAPDIVNVVLDAHGFADLLEMVDQLKAIGRHNAEVTDRVRRTRAAVAKETKRLAVDEQRQHQVTAAVLNERNEVSAIRIGLSGYRTPQHSVEVGGFANDPHTRGEASDTPGVEGVPEGTLRAFGLTRPFAGAHEADHIQLA